MANREESLKKISDELEQLSDEDLEKVAGGYDSETADDSRFLNVLLQGTKYHHCDRYGATRIFFSAAASQDVHDAWKSLGIGTSMNTLGENTYVLEGTGFGGPMTRAEAWEYAEKVVGRQLTRSQWDW